MRSTYFAGIDWVVLAAYFVATMAIGFYFYRRSPFHAFLIPVFGTLTILLLGLLISRFTAARQDAPSSSDEGIMA